jgi:hypothetical protein
MTSIRAEIEDVIEMAVNILFEVSHNPRGKQLELGRTHE